MRPSLCWSAPAASCSEAGQPFAVALAATRAGNLFTTHTAVAAGFDRFSPALMEQYLGRYAQEKLGMRCASCWRLGRQNPDDANEPFNMAYLAMRGSGAVNGVSRLHGRVSRHIFAPLFPRWPEDEVPVGHVTNGVHMPTWDSAAADELWTEACGKGRWLGTSATLEADLRRVSDEKLWAMRTASRKSLVEYARESVGRQMAAAGADSGGDRPDPSPTGSRRADPRFCPPLCDLQEAQPAAARSRRG